MAQTSRYDFFEAYAGPHGPHLDCLTEFTRTRDESKRTGRGLHYGGKTGHSTSKAPLPSTKRRLIAAITAHCARHPNDKVQEARLSRLTAA